MNTKVTKALLDEIYMDLDIKVCEFTEEGMDKDVIKEMLHQLVNRLDYETTAEEDASKDLNEQLGLFK